MMQMVMWMAAITVSVAGLALTAGGYRPVLHMVIAGAVAAVISLWAIRENGALGKAGASEVEVASVNARYMSIVWSWGALALLVTYATGILQWKEWWQFFLGFLVAAGVSSVVAVALARAARSGSVDPSMMSLARYGATLQLVGCMIAAIGLLFVEGSGFRLGGKLTRWTNARYTDWAANDVFFFGAVALAVISALALSAGRRFRNKG